ncbi:MAG: viral A-type inclusion protein [Campylobacter sp.]|nr:viral A-type inclusion protein [Campylobacter sp.]
MQICIKIFLFGFLITFLSADDIVSTNKQFMFNKDITRNVSQTSENLIEDNIIYVRNIDGIGESLETAKKDAIQNAMRFGVGELLVSKEELNNDELKQEITNYSNAYVLDYKQTQEIKDAEIYKIKADVTLEKNKVLGTLNKLNINVLDLSSGVLKNYSEDMANKKENAEKLIINEIVEPFKNGYAYDLEILDLQPIDRSDLIKSRDKYRKFTDITYYEEAIKEINMLYVAKIKIEINRDFLKKAEKIISQFSEKLSENKENLQRVNFAVDNRLYFITDDYIRERLFNENLNNFNIYGFLFRLINNNNELWITKCVIPDLRGKTSSYVENTFYIYESNFGNPDRQFITTYLPFYFKLKKLKKITESDKKDNIEYYYDEYNHILNFASEIDPKKYIRRSNGLITHKYLNFNSEAEVFYVIIRLDEQDIANTNKIELDFLYTKKNECND